MGNNFKGLKSTYIGNITLSTSLQPVTVSSDTLISKILFDTQDGTDVYKALSSDATEFYLYSNDRSSLPFVMNYDRRYASDTTILFYVKGTTGSIFQYECFVE